MTKKYYVIVSLTIGYALIYLSALIFATGVGIGIKLDDHQLPGYLLGLALLLSGIGGLRVSTRKFQKRMLILLSLVTLSIVLLFSAGTVGANEGMFIFILPIFLFPLIILAYLFDYYKAYKSI